MTADQLKVFRARHDLTQQGLADLLGLTRNAVNLMEMGERPILSRTELALETIHRQLKKPRAREKTKS
jgi:DNA-binding XRE family transcriptional regulator